MDPKAFLARLDEMVVRFINDKLDDDEMSFSFMGDLLAKFGGQKQRGKR